MTPPTERRAPSDPLALADWRRRVAELYGMIRAVGVHDPVEARRRFAAERDLLFRTHPATPLSDAARGTFEGLPYFAYRPEWRLVGHVEMRPPDRIDLDLGADGALSLFRVGRVTFTGPEGSGSLDLFWTGGYGGGLFLPFGDPTNGGSTYGGGRYLYDTIKGADLGVSPSGLLLDFNFAYNPSCAYDERWVCPLPSGGNRLPFPVPVGERTPDR